MPTLCVASFDFIWNHFRFSIHLLHQITQKKERNNSTKITIKMKENDAFCRMISDDYALLLAGANILV